MCHKIRCDEESWKFFGFQGELNKALGDLSVFLVQFRHVRDQIQIYLSIIIYVQIDDTHSPASC